MLWITVGAAQRQRTDGRGDTEMIDTGSFTCSDKRRGHGRLSV
jgi:hypothetical protein